MPAADRADRSKITSARPDLFRPGVLRPAVGQLWQLSHLIRAMRMRAATHSALAKALAELQASPRRSD
jgi:hypothetical protein